MQNKAGQLFKNMGWMTVSNFAAKILVFLMVPFYTRVLTSEGYGFYDLGYTAVTLLVPLLTLNVAEALMRFSIVDRDEIPAYFSSAFLASVALGALAVVAAFVCPAAVPFESGLGSCLVGSFVLTAANVFYVLFSQFARGIDQVKVMAFGGLVDSVLLVALSFLFVSGFGLGTFGCFLGAAGAFGSAAVYMAVRCEFWKYLTRPSLSCVKDLGKYGMPLSVNTLGWWVNSSFGRYAVASISGVSPAGMLAAAYKVPSIPKAIQQIFVQAWQISSITEYDKDDKDGFFGKTYDVVSCLSALLISSILLCLPLIARIMFSDEFFSAWVYVPLLLVGLLFDCLSSVVGAVFLCKGDTKPIAVSAAISVAVAVTVCLVLVPYVGTWGAVISSMLSSFVIWAVRFRLSRDLIHMKSQGGVLLRCLVFLGVQIVLAMVLPLGWPWLTVQVACFLLLCFGCRKTLRYRKILGKAAFVVSGKNKKS